MVRGSLPCKRISSSAKRHGSMRTAASIETSAFTSSSEADELSLLLLIKLQLPTTETETVILLFVIFINVHHFKSVRLYSDLTKSHTKNNLRG